MRFYTYTEIGVPQTSTAGAAGEIGVFPLTTKNPYHAIEGMAYFGSPATTVSFVPEEGVDSPIYSRDGTAEELPFVAFRKKRAFEWVKNLNSAFIIGTPLTVVTIPPDTTCILPVGKMLDYPFRNWVKKTGAQRFLASLATLPTQGFWGERVPAGTYTTSSCRVLEEIQRHLLESTIDSGMTWSLWTSTEVFGYLNQRISKFMSATSLINTRIQIPVTFGTTNVTLPDDLMEIRRVAWNGSGLARSDEWVADQGFPGWDGLQGTPSAYFETPPLSIRLVPTPSQSGTLDVLYVPNPAEVNSVCSNLPIPNMFTPYLKYGVMADMFSKQGEANDPERAQYCEKRFAEGIIMAKLLLGLKS